LTFGATVASCRRSRPAGDHHRPIGEAQRAVNGSPTGPSEASRTAGPLDGSRSAKSRYAGKMHYWPAGPRRFAPPAASQPGGLAALRVPLFVTARLRVPVEIIVRDLNRFLRGWAGYFRYGNSGTPPSSSTRSRFCAPATVGLHCPTSQTPETLRLVGRRSPDAPHGPDQPQRNHHRAAANATASGELNAGGEERR
jgi:Group II intron, maturase-specific domain